MLQQNDTSRGKVFATIAGVLFLFAFLTEIPWQYFHTVLTYDGLNFRVLIMAFLRPNGLWKDAIIDYNRYVVPFFPYWSALLLAAACFIGKRNIISVSAVGVAALYHGALSLRFVLLGLISNVRLIAGQFEYLEGQIGTILLGMFQRWNLVLSFLFASILLLLMAILVAIPVTRKKCGFLKFVFFLPALVLALSNLLQFFLIVLDVLYSVLILNASISLTELIEALPMCVCCDIFYFAAVLLMGLWLALGASRKNKKV